MSRQRKFWAIAIGVFSIVFGMRLAQWGYVDLNADWFPFVFGTMFLTIGCWAAIRGVFKLVFVYRGRPLFEWSQPVRVISYSLDGILYLFVTLFFLYYTSLYWVPILLRFE